MIQYVFREDSPLPIKGAKDADAQVIGEALEEIRLKAGGELTPGAVVEAARTKRSALHKHFEWNDAVAAEAFLCHVVSPRGAQARRAHQRAHAAGPTGRPALVAGRVAAA